MKNIEFIKELEKVIKLADPSVAGLELVENGDYVEVEYNSGYSRKICVAMNSKMAIIYDVADKLL